jgi:hypothetical protein
MAKISKLYSDNGRTNLLDKTVSTAQSDKDNNQHFISDETLAASVEFLPKWKQATLAVNQFLSAREREVREKNEAMLKLEKVLRDFWEVLKRRNTRWGIPAEVLTYYQLPLNGNVPKSLKHKELLTLSPKVIEGDKLAIEKGYQPMLNPDVAELQEAYNAALKETNDVVPADRAYDQAEETIESLRGQADELISDIIDELKFHLRKKDGASQRRIIKSYGVNIEYQKNESTQEDTPLEEM